MACRIPRRAVVSMSTSPNYGWRVVAALFVTLMTSSGLGFYNLAVYMTVLADARAIPVSAMSGALTMYFFGGGLAGLLVARLIERFDVRWSIGVGALLAGASLAAVGAAEAAWQVYVLFALFGIGNAGCSMVPATTLVARWFSERRSVALSVTSTGLSVGGVVVTPASVWLLHQWGVSFGMPLLGLLYVLGTAQVALWVVRPWPVGAGPSFAGLRPADGVVYADAVRSRYFVAMTAAYVLIMMAQVGGIAHTFNLVSVRADTTLAATAMAVLATASIVGRLVGGWLVLAVSTRGFALLNLAMQAGALMAMGLASARWALLASVLWFGLTVGNLLMLQPLLIAEAFGVRDYGRIYALGQAATMFGVALGPAIIGVVFDYGGGYTPAYVGMGAVSVVAWIMLGRGGSPPLSGRQSA